jgi:hypothetical protein
VTTTGHLAERVGVLAEVAERIASVPGVASVGTGSPGEPATFGPGHVIRGLAERGETLEVVISAEASTPDLLVLAEQIRSAAAWPGRVDVTIADLWEPPPPPPPPSPHVDVPGGERARRPADDVPGEPVAMTVIGVAVVDTAGLAVPDLGPDLESGENEADEGGTP